MEKDINYVKTYCCSGGSSSTVIIVTYVTRITNKQIYLAE